MLTPRPNAWPLGCPLCLRSPRKALGPSDQGGRQAPLCLKQEVTPRLLGTLRVRTKRQASTLVHVMV